MEKFEEIIDNDTPVLIDFFATWCGPCKMMHPVLDELKKEFGDRLKIIMIDIDKSANKKIVEKYSIQSVPTLLLFKNGKMLWKQSGAMSKDKLKEIVEEYNQ